MYTERLKKILLPEERKLLSRFDSPSKIQDYLDSISVNYERRGETYMSVRRTLKAKTAHCFEGALVAAAALAYHGQKPLLMDLRTNPTDEDHVITLYTRNGYWGAVSKTNHPVLRYRDAVYESPRELAMSYFHEYFDKKGKKTLREYSRPFDLSKYAPEKWIADEEDLVWLVNALDDSKHFPLVPKKNLRILRNAPKFEIRAMALTEWDTRGNLKDSNSR